MELPPPFVSGRMNAGLNFAESDFQSRCGGFQSTTAPKLYSQSRRVTPGDLELGIDECGRSGIFQKRVSSSLW